MPGSTARRGALLRLAAWFDVATTDEADRLAAVAFGMYPSRHLGWASGSTEADAAATASWWASPPAGSPGARPKDVQPANPSLHQTLLRESSESNARRRRSAAAEIRERLAVPTAAEGETALDLTEEAFELLLELVTAAIPRNGSRTVSESMADLTLEVEQAPQARINLRKDGGELHFHGVRLSATRYEKGATGDD